MSNEWKWCVQDDDGKTVKGWYQDQGNEKWYYLNDEGIMQTGWFQDKDGRWYFLDDTGAMQTGWLKSPYSGKWFYLNTNSDGYMGCMYTKGTHTIDGKDYEFDDSGAWIEQEGLLSEDCISFVKSWEGFVDEGRKYVDCVGVVTQGYGLTGKEIEGLPDQISEPEAAALLKKVMECNYAKPIKEDLDNKGISLEQNQFDSIVSFAYNCGVGALLGSTLYRRISEGVRDESLLENFQAWSKGGGRTIEGLYKRRTSEARVFLYSDYTGNR